MNFNSQDYLAKLLAKEDLTVTHGNFPTASFDVVNRELRLPLWKDKGKAVYDLLVGHEVGHALYTPVDGWHDADINVKGIPRSYLNIVEDIRIEKLIQRTYPGIVSAFKQGYKTLFADNLFGTVNKDLTKYKLMDKLNIASKSRGNVKVEFNEAEQLLVNKAMAVETWVDVINICKEIQEYVLENEKEEEQDQEQNTDEQGEEASGDEEQDTGTGDTTGDSESTRESDTPEDVQGQQDTLTDNAFRNNEDSLLDTDEFGNQPMYSRGVSKDELKGIIIDYDTLEASRNNQTGVFDSPYRCKGVEAKCRGFIKESKGLVSAMAREFERKKAAFEYSRSQTAKKGSLDVNKLHQYQYSEDIFLTVTKLAQAKSHGIISVLDWSGSMSGVALDVVKQTIVIALFCKRVNIPFEFYTFTTGSNNLKSYSSSVGSIHGVNRTKIVNITNSYLKKAVFERSLFDMYTIGVMVGDYTTRQKYGLDYRYVSKFDRMGATPLIETTLALGSIVRKFQQRNAIQNTNVIVMTDGQADRIDINSGYIKSLSIDHNTKVINFDGKKITGKNTKEIYASAVKALKVQTGATVMCFYLATNGSDFRREYCKMNEYSLGDTFNTDRSSFNRDGLYTRSNVNGYDEYLIIKVGKKEVKQEFEIQENKGGRDIEIKDIKRQFKSFNRTKRSSKLLVNKITDVVAA